MSKKNNHHGHCAFFDDGRTPQRSRQPERQQTTAPKLTYPSYAANTAVYDPSRSFVFAPSTFMSVSSSSSLRLLILLTLVAAAASKEFPAHGTYKDQKNYLNTLSSGCRYEAGEAIQALKKAQNPFADILRPDLGLQTEVWKHSVDPKFDTATKRHKIVTGTEDKTEDKTEIIVPGTSKDGSVLYTFHLDEEGNWRPTSVEAGVFDRETFGGSDAYVYKVSDGERNCFGHKDPEPTASPKP